MNDPSILPNNERDLIELLIRRRNELTYCRVSPLGKDCHSSDKAVCRSSCSVFIWWLVLTRRPNSSQTCSIGFRSRDTAAQGRRSTLFCAWKCRVIKTVWGLVGKWHRYLGYGETVWHEDARRRRCNDEHSNCLALQPTLSSSHQLYHPKPSNCPHQTDPFPARSNPQNTRLCGR